MYCVIYSLRRVEEGEGEGGSIRTGPPIIDHNFITIVSHPAVYIAMNIVTFMTRVHKRS